MSQKELKNIAEILHTIFCNYEHEQDMMMIENSPKCTFYLENSIDRTWELPIHSKWLNQAKKLIKISEPLNVSEVLQDIVKIYQIIEQFRKVSPVLLDYIRIIIDKENL